MPPVQHFRSFTAATLLLALIGGCETSQPPIASCIPDHQSDSLRRLVSVQVATGPCEIISTPVDTAFEYDELRGLDFVPPLRRFSDGSYVSGGSQRIHLHEWNPSGRAVRTVGQKGQGPGEFEFVGAIYVDPFDSLHVADLPGRWHVFDRNLAYVRTNHFLISEWTDAVFLPDGTVLAGRNAGYPSGHLFFIVDRLGSIKRSFGQASHGGDTRRLAYNGGSVFWAASPTAYRLEAWDVNTGELLGVIDRKVDWFPPSSSGAAWDPMKGESIIAHMHLDSHDRLWVTSLQPQEMSAKDVTDRADFIVEVFDTGSGQLLASDRFDSAQEGVPGGFLSGSMGWLNFDSGDGVLSAQLRRFDLRLVE